MRLQTLARLAPLLLTGCASSTALLAPYAPIPATCEAIYHDMTTLAERDAKVLLARSLKGGVATGIGLVAAAGAIPTGFAWVPLVVSVAASFQLSTHETRIAYLADQYGYRDCHRGTK